jgi:7,8-dihydropterin-6-yl-methyl-4-(beta-D-ribofuranosyl)aminobenzene 5'-phosphate synthase
MTVLQLEPVDGVEITMLADNVTDALILDHGPAKRNGGVAQRGKTPPTLAADFLEGSLARDALLAEHGFSALVTVKNGGARHQVLFDAGLTPDGAAENMRRLDLKPQDIEVIVFSHGHFDHTTGLHGFVRALGRTNLPVIIHPEFWTQRRIAIPGGDPVEVPSTSRSALVGAGFEVIEERQPSFLLHGSLLVTGEVDRTTEFEKGFPIHQALRDGLWQPDPLILDDQALIVRVRDKGLVVLTGCGHAGIINIVRYAKKLTGVDGVYAVIGGFHLNGPLFEPIIPAVCDAFESLAPQYLVPAHCTGWRAVHALAARFPDAFIQTVVGTRFGL